MTPEAGNDQAAEDTDRKEQGQDSSRPDHDAYKAAQQRQAYEAEAYQAAQNGTGRVDARKHFIEHLAQQLGAERNNPAPFSQLTGLDVYSLDPMMQFFRYQHLSLSLQGMSKLFHDVAVNLVVNAPRNPERTVALRKLLEAKDAGVRSLIYK